LNLLPLSLIAKIDAATSTACIGDDLQDFLEREIGVTAISSLTMNSPTPKSFSAHFNKVPKAWAQRYLDAKYLPTDPFVARLFLTRTPYSWQEVMECGPIGPKAQELIGDAGEFDLSDGYFVPVHRTDGNYGLVGLFGRALEMAHLRPVVDFLCVYAHFKSELLQNAARPRRAQLSPREIECLKWVSCGKSDTAIGEILAIADGTVNMHIESAKRKYRATTRVQAVIEALRDGYLFL
jgi:DNA-binding CsgD family transcriptional regulator